MGDEEEALATCDAVTAFRQSRRFGPDEKPKYVGYKAHSRAPLRVFKLLGSLYLHRILHREHPKYLGRTW